MLKFIKRHEKKALAFFGVALMITFVASSGYGRGAGGRSDMVIGKIDGKAVYSSELAQSRAEWQALNRYFAIPNPESPDAPPTPLAYRMLPEGTAHEINDQPELFMLLRHEARAQGIVPDGETMQAILAEYYHPATGDDAEDQDALAKQALADLLAIEANLHRVADLVKISQPAREHELAEALQKITLKYLPLAADDFSAKVPAPTTQAMQQQFEHFANTDPGHPDAATGNPFGFGYKLPQRVKLQYIAIDRAEAEKAVAATKSAYDWDVQAQLYYLRHKDEFPATQPAVAGPAAPTSQPATPAVQPFAQVKDQALRAVRDPLVNQLMLNVQTKLVAGMIPSAGALSGSTANGAAAKGTPAFASAAYLQQLADSVGRPLGMKLFVTDLDAHYLSAKDLSSAAVGAIADASVGQTPFAELAMQQASSDLARTDLDTPAGQAALLAPAPPLTDSLQNAYLFRLTAVRPAEPAPNLAAVEDQVRSDLRMAEGYKIAETAAKAMLAQARKTSFDAVAKAAGKTVGTTDAFSSLSPYFGVGITLSPAGQSQFLDQAFNLLAGYNPTRAAHPLGLIAVPPDGKIYVAQINSVVPSFGRDQYWEAAQEITRSLRRIEQQPVVMQWLSYPAVVKRVGYQPTAADKEAQG